MKVIKPRQNLVIKFTKMCCSVNRAPNLSQTVTEQNHQFLRTEPFLATAHLFCASWNGPKKVPRYTMVFLRRFMTMREKSILTNGSGP